MSSPRKQITRSLLAVVLGVGSGIGGVTLAATPASAASINCYAGPYDGWEKRTFYLPGKPDVTMHARACIWKDGYYRRAFIEYKWSGGYSIADRFDKFIIKPRLERYDTVLNSAACDIKGRMNDFDSPSGSGKCWTAVRYSTATGGWTGDGTIVYNINDDGKDDFVWGLHGSGQVSIAGEGQEEDDSVDNPADDPNDPPIAE